MKVSNSRIQAFRKCHYSHYLKYVAGLVKKEKGGALERGSVLHECVEYYCTGRSWRRPYNKFAKEFYNKHFAEEIVELGDIPAMVKALMENYQEYYEEEPYDYISCEQYFELPLIQGVDLIGYIDAIVSEEGNPKNVWGKEIKTYSKTPDRDFLVMNNQSSLYMWALEKLGFPVKGMLWDIIRAKEPTKPRLTAGGKLSQARIDSTPLSLRKGIIELGLDPKEYEDFISTGDYSNYLYRFPIRKNDQVIQTILEDTKSTAKDIRDRGEELRDRNLGKECAWCSYKDICQAEMLGLDTSYIIKKHYTHREENDNGNKEKKSISGKNRNRG